MKTCNSLNLHLVSYKSLIYLKEISYKHCIESSESIAEALALCLRTYNVSLLLRRLVRELYLKINKLKFYRMPNDLG